MRVHEDWLLTPQRVAVHLPTATAVVADPHLGYNQARRRRGEAIPLSDISELINTLAIVQSRHGLRRLIIAGDLFEDATGRTLVPELRQALAELHLELAGVVPGNHDAGWMGQERDLPLYPEGLRLGDWQVLHGDGPLPAGRLILGHLHPCLRWNGRLTAPCYLVGQERLVLPAFSPDAAGANVLSLPSWHACRCAVIAGDRVLDFGEVFRLQRPRGKRR
jgi:hypothetical protein